MTLPHRATTFRHSLHDDARISKPPLILFPMDSLICVIGFFPARKRRDAYGPREIGNGNEEAPSLIERQKITENVIDQFQVRFTAKR